MEHLEDHPHAFIDVNNVVLNVAVFNEHDEVLIETIRLVHEGAVKSLCCCNYGLAVIGSVWNGERFCGLDGVPLPLTRQPIKTDHLDFWRWNETQKEWINYKGVVEEEQQS
jgi:hypothetical protein